jgi:hypothetical protein
MMRNHRPVFYIKIAEAVIRTAKNDRRRNGDLRREA